MRITKEILNEIIEFRCPNGDLTTLDVRTMQDHLLSCGKAQAIEDKVPEILEKQKEPKEPSESLVDEDQEQFESFIQDAFGDSDEEMEHSQDKANMDKKNDLPTIEKPKEAEPLVETTLESNAEETMNSKGSVETTIPSPNPVIPMMPQVPIQNPGTPLNPKPKTSKVSPNARFPCGFCGKVFTTQGNARRHTVTICEVAKAAGFGRKPDLNQQQTGVNWLGANRSTLAIQGEAGQEPNQDQEEQFESFVEEDQGQFESFVQDALKGDVDMEQPMVQKTPESMNAKGPQMVPNLTSNTVPNLIIPKNPKMLHPRIPKFGGVPCGYCGKIFSTQSNARRHAVTNCFLSGQHGGSGFVRGNGSFGPNRQAGQIGTNGSSGQVGKVAQRRQVVANGPFGHISQVPQGGHNGQIPQYGQGPQSGQNPQLGQSPHLGQIGQLSPIGQTGQNPQFGQFGQLSQYGQAGQIPQYGQLGQISQLGQPGQLSQIGHNGQIPQSGQTVSQFGQVAQIGQNEAPGQVRPSIESIAESLASKAMESINDEEEHFAYLSPNEAEDLAVNTKTQDDQNLFESFIQGAFQDNDEDKENAPQIQTLPPNFGQDHLGSFKGQNGHIEQYKCEYCPKKFLHLKNLNNHLQYKHGNQGQPGQKFECDQCHKEYSSKASLLVHMRSQHSGVRYNCKQCDANYAHKHELVQHIKSKHEGVTYNCELCTKSFIHKVSLKDHIQAKHLKIKSHQCRECGLHYTSHQTLYIHRKNKHPHTIKQRHQKKDAVDQIEQNGQNMMQGQVSQIEQNGQINQSGQFEQNGQNVPGIQAAQIAQFIQNEMFSQLGQMR